MIHNLTRSSCILCLVEFIIHVAFVQYHTLEDLAIDHFEHFADEQGNRLPVLMVR